MITENRFIKYIKKQLGDLIDTNDTEMNRVDCGLQNFQATNLPDTAVKKIENIGLAEYVMLLQATYAKCTEFYKVVQHHLTLTKTKSDKYRVIDPPTLKMDTIPKSTPFSD